MLSHGKVLYKCWTFFHLKINHNLQYVLQANSFKKIHFSRMLINDYDVIIDTTKKF